ncbi:MAG: urease accessory protein UreE [Thermosynechococcaceae cyanobacterium]
MLVFSERSVQDCQPDLILSLTAAERVRSHFPFTTDDGTPIYLQLPRGTVLQDGDLLIAKDQTLLQIKAKLEPVLVVQAKNQLDLLRAAYHLGNRHVALEITPTCLRLAPDPVLQDMLLQLQLDVATEAHPFQPETGAYRHSH